MRPDRLEILSLHAKPRESSRREFLKWSGKLAAGSALAGVAIPHVHAAEENTIRLALIGCGGRGSGAVVNSIALGAREAGDSSFYWNGKDAEGNTIATGPLQVRVRGASPTNVATWASIAAVQSPADGTASRLITALGTYSPADAIKLA